MPVAPTYPGVYIEEIPSGVRAITGVPTAITAFVGRASRGPLDDPRRISSFAEYERLYGGLAADSQMSYAVQSFFQNGGGDALVVRVALNADAATINLPAGADTLDLVASSAGTWANTLTASVDHATMDADDPDPDVNLFNLTVSAPGRVPERHLNVSIDPAAPRFVARVLEHASELVRVTTDANGDPVVPDDRPDETADPVESNADGTDGDAVTSDEYNGSQADKTGIFALERADLFNLLCLPPPTRDSDGFGVVSAVYPAAAQYCVDRRAMLIVDPDPDWTDVAGATAGVQGIGIGGTTARNAAVFVPGIRARDPLLDNQVATIAPSGAVAGIFARTDGQRGVWKAPAGVDAGVNGAVGVGESFTDDEIGQLNPLGIDCIKAVPVFGTIVWGSRTMRGADQLADDYKYVPVRRL
ncbi:MAG TPA: phage tail sheath family protein, partial [Actinomycetota bacterium]|nr:phage tail sheath family protein [Actinomycetota bacterium]